MRPAWNLLRRNGARGYRQGGGQAMTKPPKVPREKDYRAQLAAMGVADNPVQPVAAEWADKVHATLVELWKETGRAPHGTTIMERSGMDQGRVYRALRDLAASGRVLHPRQGVWVPVVTRKDSRCKSR
jgi:hypothetical protein